MAEELKQFTYFAGWRWGNFQRHVADGMTPEEAMQQPDATPYTATASLLPDGAVLDFRLLNAAMAAEPAHVEVDSPLAAPIPMRARLRRLVDSVPLSATVRRVAARLRPAA